MTRLAALVALAFLSSCGKNPEWRGWIYPSAAENRHYFELGTFPDELTCRIAGEAILRHISIATFRQRENPDDKGRVDCGRACRRDRDADINVCEDITRSPLR